jgi:ribosomal protein S19
MSRSKWKTPYAYLNPNKLLKNASENKQMSRSATIAPRYLNRVYKVHNGKSFVDLQITESMMGHKFGEFAFTRSKYVFKKKKMKRKMKKKIKN